QWRTLTQMSQLWKSEYNGKPFRIDCTALPTGIESISSEIPSSFELRQNYPNPFNPTTTIRFSLPQREFVTLKVFDVLGREVATPVNGELNAGEHTVVLEAKSLASGVYFYQLRAAGFIQTKKMLISK
ncbi:MAG: T9SS type A sorting domain-containing protein, partial [Ignavibacteriales bacterium]|nr:T9SS type A sorting domain-containing protein [Ignavibacteriales bacterium]